MSNEELVLQQITPPEHLCQGSWSGDTECAQPQPIALQTLHTTPRRSERLLKAAVGDPGQVFLPSFVLPTAHTERLSPPPASSPGGITCYSKPLLQDAAGKLVTTVSGCYNEFQH